jgi:integral membrane protein
MVLFFRLIAFLEGLSYVLLMAAAIYKRTHGSKYFVKLLGMPHGILFVIYIILAFVLKTYFKWDLKTFSIVLIASILPFGTFYIEKKYL